MSIRRANEIKPYREYEKIFRCSLHRLNHLATGNRLLIITPSITIK